MTVRELRSQLSNLDDNCEIMMQTSGGSKQPITNASQQGDHLIMWADSNS